MVLLCTCRIIRFLRRLAVVCRAAALYKNPLSITVSPHLQDMSSNPRGGVKIHYISGVLLPPLWHLKDEMTAWQIPNCFVIPRESCITRSHHWQREQSLIASENGTVSKGKCTETLGDGIWIKYGNAVASSGFTESGCFICYFWMNNIWYYNLEDIRYNVSQCN